MALLRSAIADLLRERGSLTDEDLLEKLRGSFKELTPLDLKKTLMKMEVLGLIRVTSLGKGRKRVEWLGGQAWAST